MPTKDIIMHALISILVGASISFLTVVFQGILDLLHQFGPAGPGVIAGVAMSWRRFHA